MVLLYINKNNMTIYHKISSFFLLASISTIFIGKISILGPFKISDYLLIISFLFFIIAVFKTKINVLGEIKYIRYIIISILIILIGTISSLIIFRDISIFDITKGYCHIIANSIIFIEILILSNNNKSFPKKILLCFLFSLLIIPFIYIPEINKYFLFGNYRFRGLFNDPNYFVNFQIIPTLLILFFIIKENINKIIKVVLFIIFCVSVGLILWSGSRSGLLGLIASFVSLIFLLIYSIPKKKILGIIFLILISFPIGFYIIPKESHKNIIARTDKIQMVKTKVLSNIITEKTKIPTKIIRAPIALIYRLTSGQDRLNIWKNSLFFIIKNPLGYGPGYNKIVNIKGDGFEHRATHNFELELLLIGGIGLFIIINLFLLKIAIEALKNCYKQKFNELHVLLPILIGILVSGMFLDIFLFFLSWIIVALIIIYNRQIYNHKNKES